MAHAVGYDSRIGNKFLQASVGKSIESKWPNFLAKFEQKRKIFPKKLSPNPIYVISFRVWWELLPERRSKLGVFMRDSEPASGC